MSIISNESVSERQTVFSDIGDLKEFSSKIDIFAEPEANKESFYVENKVKTSFDYGRINSSVSKNSISSIQELFFYVDENVAGNGDFRTAKFSDFMNIEMARECYCDSKNDTIKRSRSEMKLSEAHCSCPIASSKHKTIQHVIMEKYYEDEPAFDQHKFSNYQIVFEVEPYSVLFLNCEPGKTYVKSIKITNRSNSSQKFELSALQENSPFKLKVISSAECDTNRIATGLSFRIQVIYACKGHVNAHDILRIEGAFFSPIVIQIRAFQCPTILSELTDSESSNEMTGQRAVIKCTSCFPTESTSHRVELLNFSETFNFLILDRKMWTSQSSDALRTINNKLVVGVFTIFPAYFQTNRGSSVIINVQFNPKEAGKFCKKLYIICDNMSVNIIQLIGQAYQFNKSMLLFMNMGKTYCANMNDYIEAEYFLNMGSVYRGRKKRKIFTILNDSECTLQFHWELHCYPLPGYKKMTSRMIKLTHKQGIFRGKRSNNFSVTVNMARSSVGEYRTLACLYIDNLMETKVDISFKNNLLNRSKRRGYSLLIASIEIHAQCRFTQIETTPQVISLRRIPLLCGPQHKFSTNVKVKNLSPVPVRCVWKNLVVGEKVRVKLEVHPKKAKIAAKTERNFVISIIGISPGCFSQHLFCTSNSCNVGILVEGNCTMGFLHVRDDFISCGVIKKDKKLRLDVSFENHTNCKWSRMLSEYTYHSRKSYKPPKLTDGCKRFLALQFKKKGLYDSFNRAITFQYNTVNTNIDRNVIWCSLLKWKVGDAVDYIGVIADIERPLATLSESDMSDDNLLMNSMSIIRLELRNHGTLSAVFAWCEPIGEQRYHFECKIKPARGILKQYEKCEILIYIRPLKMATIKDLYFMCIVEGMVKPLVVSLNGRVHPAIIEFHWYERAKDTKEFTAFWRSVEENSRDSKTISSILSNKKIVVSNANPEKLSISPPGSLSKKVTINETLSADGKIEGESISDTNNHYGPNHYRIINSNMKLNYDFIGKIVIEVDSCHSAKMESLQVKNCTKATVSYSTNIIYFYPKKEFDLKQIPDEHDYLKWQSLIQPEMGVVICVENPLGQINGLESGELSIWAFATSWGIYKDVLKIDGDGQLPTAYFEVEVICISSPIQFPAVCKPVLRLCAIHCHDSGQSYPIRVKNNSSSNILVHWSIHDILDYMESRKTWPFKLDLWDASEDVKNWGLTLKPFYGQLYMDTFSVDEPYFPLKAWSERILTLNVNPCDLNTDNVEMPLALNAVLVASVFRDPDYEEKHANWNQGRMAAVETAHLLIKINLDKPKLVLLNAEMETLQFIIRGEDLWNSKIYRQSKTLVWQNRSSVSTTVSFEVDDPLEIEFYKTGVESMSFNRPINLIHGQSIETLLKVTIMNGKQEIEDFIESSPIAKPSTQAEELSGPSLNREITYEKNMKVSLDGELQHIYNVELIIFLPKFKLSARKIMFNPVFSGTTKCETFDIASEDSCPINYQIVTASPRENKENVFSFYPSSGVIATRKVPATISVYFTPRFSINYRAKFLVMSSIPLHQLQFSVSGHGTYNSKHKGNEFPPK